MQKNASFMQICRFLKELKYAKYAEKRIMQNERNIAKWKWKNIKNLQEKPKICTKNANFRQICRFKKKVNYTKNAEKKHKCGKRNFAAQK